MDTITLQYKHRDPEYRSLEKPTRKWMSVNMKVMKTGGYELEKVIHADPKVRTEAWETWEALEKEENNET